jgi:hypothetical protein
LRTGLVYVEGGREGETEEHFSRYYAAWLPWSRGWAANEHLLGVHGAGGDAGA